MAGVSLQILAIDVLIGAILLDHEHLRAQFKNGVQLFLAEVLVMLADPFDGHRMFLKCSRDDVDDMTRLGYIASLKSIESFSHRLSGKIVSSPC
ncbi:hypothetical protein D3C76_1468240 [compost metagenome]